MIRLRHQAFSLADRACVRVFTKSRIRWGYVCVCVDRRYVISHQIHIDLLSSLLQLTILHSHHHVVLLLEVISSVTYWLSLCLVFFYLWWCGLIDIDRLLLNEAKSLGIHSSRGSESSTWLLLKCRSSELDPPFPCHHLLLVVSKLCFAHFRNDVWQLIVHIILWLVSRFEFLVHWWYSILNDLLALLVGHCPAREARSIGIAPV